MKIQIVILLVACLGCLIPEVHSIGLLSILAGKALAAKGLILGAGAAVAKKAALGLGSASILAGRSPIVPLTKSEVVVEEIPDVVRTDLNNAAVVETVRVEPIYGLRTDFYNNLPAAPPAPVAPVAPIYRNFVPAAPVMRYEAFEPSVEIVEPSFLEPVPPQYPRLIAGRLATLTEIASRALHSKFRAVGDLISALCGHHSVVVSTQCK